MIYSHLPANRYMPTILKLHTTALLASSRFGGLEIAMYSPLEDSLGDHNHQCEIEINCCFANYPRGYMMMARYAIMTLNDEVYLNLYSNLSASFALPSKNNTKYESKCPVNKSNCIFLN